MKIEQEFTLPRRLDAVWAFFHDPPAVAACLPGAEYLADKGDGVHAGKVSVKVGPFQANFEGAATVAYDDAARTVTLDGKGVDRRGASRGKMTMVCRLSPVGEGTRVVLDADVQLAGSIAQFGRTGLIQEIATLIVGDFVKNVEARLPSTAMPMKETRPAAGPAIPISGLRLVWLSLYGFFARLFGRG